MAQIGSALPWGGRGRRFKSCHSDDYKTALAVKLRRFLILGESHIFRQNKRKNQCVGVSKGVSDFKSRKPATTDDRSGYILNYIARA